MDNNTGKVHFVEVDEDMQHQRIDNYLSRYLHQVPKTHIYKIIRKGEVRVNKKRIKPVYKLVIGDLIRIPPVKTAEKITPCHPCYWPIHARTSIVQPFP